MIFKLDLGTDRAERPVMDACCLFIEACSTVTRRMGRCDGPENGKDAYRRKKRLVGVRVKRCRPIVMFYFSISPEANSMNRS